MLNIDVHYRNVQYVLSALERFPKECRGAIWQAVKRSLGTLREELSKNIREVAYLKKDRLKDSISPVQMYGSRTAGSKKTTDTSHVMGWIQVSSKQLPLDAFKIVPNRPTHPAGRKMRKNMSLSGYKLGPREPVRYKQKNSDRSAGFVVKGKKGLHFLIGLNGKYHRTPDGNLHQNLIRASGYSVQYFAMFDSVYLELAKKAKRMFAERLNHEIAYRFDKIGKGK